MRLLIALLLMNSLVIAKEIKLRKDDTFLVTGGITPKMTRDLYVWLQSVKTKKINVYLLSSGGHVDAGLDIVSLLKASGKEITCVAEEAQSMAFVMLQYCDKRYAIKTAKLFHHRVAGGMSGSVTQMEKFVKSLLATESIMTGQIAKRMGVTKEDLLEELNRTILMNAEEALKRKAIDEIVTIKWDML